MTAESCPECGVPLPLKEGSAHLSKCFSNPYRNVEEADDVMAEWDATEIKAKGGRVLIAGIVALITVAFLATQCTPDQGPPPPVKPDTPQAERMIYAAV